MILLMANPETFEVHNIVENKVDDDDFEVIFKAKPPQKEIYELIELATTEGLNFEQIMEMMYSDDEETRTMVGDILKNFQPVT